MFRLATVAALLAGSLSLVAAQSYADFTLDTSVATTFADTVDPLGTFNGDVETNRAACDALDNCIGMICREFHLHELCVTSFLKARTDILTAESSVPNCILLAVGDTSDSANAGFDSIHWK